jgi:hypothetical protein
LGIVTGSGANELVIRSNSQGIRFSLDNGATTQMSIESAGVTINAGSGTTLTVGGASALSLSAVTVTTTSPAAGGAGALPATPAGYMAITIAGVARRIPFYT